MSTFRNGLIGLFGCLFTLLGAALALGGGWLIALGGSPFYIVAGALMAATGVFLFRRRALALGLSLALLLLAAAWSWYEAGADFWAWVPRIITFLVVALATVAVSPWLMRRQSQQSALPKRTAAALAAPLVVALAGLFGGMFVVHPSVAASGKAADVIKPAAGNDLGNDWTAYGRGTNGNRFVQFTQINKGNIAHLKEAWRFRTGDMAINGAEYQGTPLKVNNSVYVCTPHNIVFALDPVTGKKRWAFDPRVAETAGNKTWARCRGLGYYDADAPTEGVQAVAAETQPADCRKRIIMTTIDARLLAINADTGELCKGFGNNGSVNLLDHLGPRAPGDYYPTSAPLVAGNVIVVGGKLNDNLTVGEPSGVVRGYDVKTGAQVWGWDPLRPKRGTEALAAGETYAGDSPNFWGTASYDPKLGLVYIPTGNQTPDFWNGDRSAGSDEYTDSIVAIDVKTGIDRWHFRTANHDMFDYDVSSQPILYDLPGKDGGTTPVVIAPTKRGQIFVLDRRTGHPVFPVEQRKIATDGMPGMRISPTQPYSAISVGGTLAEKDMWGASVFDQLFCRIEFKQMHWEGEFTPLNDTQNTLIYPGYYGGFNWGGGALDPSTGTLIINDIRMAQWGRFIRREEATRLGLKATTEGEYSQQLGTPWGVVRSMFMSPLGVPCFKPPFGTLSAISLISGKTQWQVPMGSIQDAPVHGVVPGVKIPLGMPTMGGPLVTKSGLTFFFGTLDYYIRAMDNQTGKEVWSSRLPVGGQGAPMSYIGADGKQYIVITVGGATRTGTNANRGDYVIAYALDTDGANAK